MNYNALLKIENDEKYLLTGEVKNVFFKPNGKQIGEFVCDVDGFYKFFPDESLNNGGCYSEEELGSLYFALEDLNREWNEIIKNDERISGANNDEPSY